MKSSITLNEEYKHILCKLNHPHLVKYLGFFQDDIIMEDCKGEDLYSLLIKRNLMKVSFEFKYKLIHQIAEALNYLHNQNIIHGDVKTKNILLDKPYDLQSWPNA